MKLNNFAKSVDRVLFKSTVLKIYAEIYSKILKRNLKNNNGYSIEIMYQKDKHSALAKLCDYYGSDKGSLLNGQHPYPWSPHTYSDYYEMIFSSMRFNVKKVFECGIGTNNSKLASNMSATGKPGASLRVWRDYFPNAQIIGGDIDKDILFEEERIETFYIDQTDPKSIQDFWISVNQDNFDLILDDGLHTTDAGIKLFTQSYEKLSPLGFYIIEDVGMHMFPDYIDYFKNKSFKVEYINLNKRNTKIGNNSLVVIRKATEL